MNFQRLLDELLYNAREVSLPLFAVELVLCSAIVALLLSRLIGLDRFVLPRAAAIAWACTALAVACWQGFGEQGLMTKEPGRVVLFAGMLVHDPLTVYIRILVCAGLLLSVILCALTGIPDREDGPDFHSLLFGSALGAILMAEAEHVLMVFLAIEMTSVPGYAIVGFQKGRRLSGEAALKYLVYGAGAAGILLYGSSLLVGVLETASLPQMSISTARLFATGGSPIATVEGRTVILGLVLVFAGIAFKLALVPFHFWCPDAFEGATAEVAGFLSVVPKAGALALLIRVIQGVLGSATTDVEALRVAFAIGLAGIAAVTMTLGNLAAFPQTNLKRLFAYSTIAHAGYLLMGIAAWMAAPTTAGARGIEGLLYYLAVYLFMNIGVFSIVALLRNATLSENLDDYRALGWRYPVLGASMAVCCLSLVGIWPAGGFIGKFMIFAATWQAGEMHRVLWVLVAIAGVNTVWSLFYYFRILRAMYLLSDDGEATLRPISAAAEVYVIAVTLPIVLLGIIVEPLSRTAAWVAKALGT